MKKAINALSICSITIYGLSFILLLNAIIFQSELVRILLDPYSTHSFTIPIAEFFSSTFMLALSLLAFIINIKSKASLKLNIILVILPIALMLPASCIINQIQSIVCNTDSFEKINDLASISTCLNAIPYAAYMVCGGMRISCYFDKGIT